MLLGLALLLLVMLEVLVELMEEESDGEVEGEPVLETLALEERELLKVAHGVGERVLHSLTVRLLLTLALAAIEMGISVLVADWLTDTVPQVL